MLRRTRDDDYAPPAYEYEEDDAPRGRRRLGGRTLTALLLLFTLVFLAIGVLRVLGEDGDQKITVGALALTPYVAPGGLLLAIIAFGLRRRFIAAVVALIALSMVVLLLPRMLANDQPAAGGQRLRIMSANLNRGQADPAALAALVRDNEIDVLALPELTRAQLPLLEQAGLAARFPHRVLDPGVGGDGSGIMSRYPLRQTVLVESTELAQPSAVVDLPGRDDVELLLVHVQSALHDPNVWRRELARLPPPMPARVRILAGDFNASFDHAAFRSVLDLGYVDAGEQTGRGLIPTWSGRPFGPPITIDHVLLDRRCAVNNFTVLPLPGSDHDAILADLTLP